jgi:hypothetical protein
MLLVLSWLSICVSRDQVWDDMSMWNVDFAGIFTRLTLKKINKWEGAFLNALSFNVAVTASEYTKMYFNLRAYHKKAKLQMAPLNKDKARELEAMSESAAKKIRAKLNSAKVRRSQTMDGNEKAPFSSRAVIS